MGNAMDKMEQAKELANHNFNHGLSCSESVFEALHRSGALDGAEIPYSACALCAGFGGGIGLSGLTCGALSGAVMAVGAKNGRKDPRAGKPDGLYALEYRRYNNLVADFKKAMGSPLCAEITEGFHGKAGHRNPERKALCSRAVAAAVEAACKYLDMPGEEVAKLPMGDDMSA